MILTGPFSLKYGDVNIDNVTEVSFDYSADSSQPTTIDGRTLDIPTSTQLSASVSILGADTTILSALFGSAWTVLNGARMSTGETYTAPAAQGGAAQVPAIDMKALSACGSTTNKENLELIGCGYTYRLVDATVKLDSLEINDNVTVDVTLVFTSQPDSYTDAQDGNKLKQHALLQIFPTGTLA